MTRRLVSRARVTVYCLDVARPEAPVPETGPIGLADATAVDFIRRKSLVWDPTS